MFWRKIILCISLLFFFLSCKGNNAKLDGKKIIVSEKLKFGIQRDVFFKHGTNATSINKDDIFIVQLGNQMKSRKSYILNNLINLDLIDSAINKVDYDSNDNIRGHNSKVLFFIVVWSENRLKINILDTKTNEIENVTRFFSDILHVHFLGSSDFSVK